VISVEKNGFTISYGAQSHINIANTPLEFQKLKRWAVWGRMEASGTKKSPLDPHNTSKFCGCNHENRLETFEFVCNLLKEQPQLGGLAFSLPKPYLLLDFDDCLDNSGNFLSEFRYLSEDIQFLNTYTEISQSGTGLHIIGIAEAPEVWLGSYPVEIYPTKTSDSHWVYLTGNAFPQYKPGFSGKFIPTLPIREISYELSQVTLVPEYNNEFIEYQRYRKEHPDRLYSSGSITQDYEVDCMAFGEPRGKILNRPDGSMIGAHPFHESVHGHNFKLSPHLNGGLGIWHCYHHKTGGDGAMLFAVKAGIIRCEDCRPGLFKDKEFIKRLKRELEDAGYENTAPQLSVSFTRGAPLKMRDGRIL
jgi:hypothetical protein